MKKNFTLLNTCILAVASMLLMTSCEDVIDLKTETGPSQLVVDGWITNQPGPQTIRLAQSAAYFNNQAASSVLQALVTVTDDEGNIFEFKDQENKGVYQWMPQEEATTLGRIGRTYALRIVHDGETYAATNSIKRVPVIDSLIYRDEKFPFTPPEGPREGYIGEFFSKDFVGMGDTYWIKPLKGGRLYGTKPNQISIAFDGAFNPGASTDGLDFILPLRQSISINQLFSVGDAIGVEMHSITLETYYFLLQVRQESSNGGIFAVPPANIPTNIRNLNPGGKQALGYFGASAVSRLETIIDPAKARPKL